MAYTDTVLATSPLHYWPLNETSGTAAADLVGTGTLNGTCVGMVMGGGAGPTGGTAAVGGGIGGVAPVFDGTGHILVRSAAILGGLSAFTVSAWVLVTLTTSATEYVHYGEMSTTAGNDQIRAAVKGPGASPTLSLTYGNDPSLVSKSSGSVFVSSTWVLVHQMWTAGGNVELWWNGGQRSAQTGSASGAVWTNSNVAAWIGGPPRSGNGSPFIGRLAHVFVHDRKLAGPEMSTLYRAGTPLQRTLLNKTLFKSTSPWRQRLDDPMNVPTIAANSATQVSHLVNQVSLYGASVQTGGGPIWLADNSTPTERVRIVGGQNNFSLDHPNLYNALGTVPIPTGFTPHPGLADLEASVYNTDTDSFYEFWVAIKSYVAPEFLAATVQSGGTIPVQPSPYAYVVYPADGSGNIGIGVSVAATITAGNQKVQLGWGTSETAVKYRIYRRYPSAGSGGFFMVEVDSSVHSWTDDGSVTPGAANPTVGGAVTSDWGCSYAGYLASTDTTNGVYEPPRQNWGAAATSLPLFAGVITINELYNVLAGGTIDHALTMAVNDTPNTHVYPAQRHDFWNGPNNVEEGTRFRLDPTYDVNIQTNPILREMARAFQNYGGFNRDHSAAVTAAYMEDAQSLGRDPFPEALGGRLSYELMAGFPWSRMQAIDPAWTLAQTGGPVSPSAVPLSSVTDNFSGATVDLAKWTVVGAGVSQFGGQLHIQTHASPYAKLVTKVGAVPYKLTASSIFVKMPQRPTGTGGQSSDQSGFQIAYTSNASCYIQFWVEGDGMLKVDYLNTAGVKTSLGATLWNPVAHAFQRIREAAGIIYAEVSADGTTWVELTHFTWSTTNWPAGNLDDVVFTVFSGNFGGAVGRPDLLIDSVNVVEAVTPPPPPVDVLSIRPPGDSRVTNLLGKRTNVMEITAPPGEYTVAATQFGLKHIDLLVGTDVTDITYPAAGTSVQFTITAADGSTVRVMAIGSDHT